MTRDIGKYAYYSYKSSRKRRKVILISGVAGAVGLILIFFLVIFPRLRRGNVALQTETGDIYELWEAAMYDKVISISRDHLSSHPLDSEYLTLYGFASYYNAYYEKALEDKINLLDESIFSLRRAKLSGASPYKVQIDYILGQAYYHKGKYFYDLAVRYIESSLDLGYVGSNAYEYLGLAYGGLGDTKKELEAFLKAVKINESDRILLSVGKAYFKRNTFDLAEEYLLRALNKADDADIKKECHFRLADIYIQSEDYLKAETQYKAVIELDGRSAIAHFQLGEIYYKMQDIVKARSEWREAVNIDPNHRGARLRLYG